MKNAALILNLGSHDLQVKKDNYEDMKKLFSDDNEMLKILGESYGVVDNFSLFTEKLLNYYPDGLEYIDFPIIKASMEKVKNDLENDKLTEIIFVTTDQEHKKDTVNLGKILLKIKNDREHEKLKKNIGFNELKGTPKVKIWCINENPSDYDVMMKEYEYNLNNRLEGIEKLFIEITGGTPAMSTALLFNATNQINIKVNPFYIDRKSKDAYNLTISESLRKADSKKQICLFIRDQNYKGAETLIKDYASKYHISEKEQVNIVLNMIQAASSRIEFDFDSAEKYIRKVKDYSPVSRSTCSMFQNYLRHLKDKNETYLLNELKNNAVYKYNNGAYTDFLGRIFRIQEAIYSNILLSKEVVIDKGYGKLFLKEEALSETQMDKLNSAEIQSGIKLEYRDCELNIESMKKTLEIVLEDNSLELKLVNECSKLKSLKSLRNKSILAHGYSGVSKEKINALIETELDDVAIDKYLENLVIKFTGIFNENLSDDNFYNKDGQFNSQLIKLVEEI
ncbi:hypothetical protein [Clostridium ljungdahlii]|uniref:CRISPR-associated protein n=1 Tax=Clostridium ljungdahlii TaxID=1538 RepID=A0A162KVV2_9CLOT|nr:hypothetical protein [Clostridium ljungdahlii]OAA84796.1 CRISPR-associated protein [Clostridium ljungdahlii]